jgi:hypothetical protein
VNVPEHTFSTWILYCAFYVCGFAVLCLTAVWSLEGWDAKIVIPMLANVTNGSIGIGLSAALTWEIGRYVMVLAAMLKRKLEEEARQRRIAAETRLNELREEGRVEGRQEGRQEGRKEGLLAMQEAWEAWNFRRLDAEANGRPFTEPPPSRERLNSNGAT